MVHVQKTKEALLNAEDTDGNHQITIEDGGPKVCILRLLLLFDLLMTTIIGSLVGHFELWWP